MKSQIKKILAVCPLALGLSLTAFGQLQWSAYNNTGGLVTANVASGGDATYGGNVTFTIPATTQRIFTTETFLPVGVPVGNAAIKINFTMNCSGGLYPGFSGRLFGMGLLNDPGTPASGLDDTGYWTDFNTGNPSFELFDRPATVATFFQYDTTDKLGTGKVSTGYPTNGVNLGMQFQLNMNAAANSVSIGTSSSTFAACGAGMTNGNGSVVEQAYSSGVALTTLATTNFNEFAFTFNNLSASAVTVTLSGITLAPANPAISVAPVGYSGSPGDATPVADFAVSINTNAVAPLTYQWYQATPTATNLLMDGATVNGSTISGVTSSNLTFVNAQVADSANYFVVVTNVYGAVTSAPAQLNIAASATGPVITSISTTNATVIAGNGTNITVAATGSPSPVFFWYDNNGNLLQAGANPVLALANVAANAGGLYSVTASNSVATATTNFAINVIVTPTISAQPVSLLVNVGDPASFLAAAAGVPQPVYQWYHGGTPIPNATNGTYAIGSVALSDIGTYYLIATNPAGSVTSSNVYLAVYSTISGTPQTPANGAVAICYDTPLTLAFGQPVAEGSHGQVRIYNVTNGAVPVDVLDLGQNFPTGAQGRTIGGEIFNTYPVIANGNTAVIYPHGGVLTSNQTYYVMIDPGVILDANGAYWAGISATNVWQFTTKIAGPANPVNPIVAADGSGDFLTVQGAVDSVPAANTTPVEIDVHNGFYQEVVDIHSKNNILVRGQSRAGTVIGYANNAGIAPGGSTHSRMAFKIYANNISLDDLTITNLTAQDASQAEALMIETGARQAIVNNANIDSSQDTILANTSSSQVYFNNSLIQGDVDFIWGGGNLFFTNCEILWLTRPGNSQALGPNPSPSATDINSNGFAFVNCLLTTQAASAPDIIGRTRSITNGESVLIGCLVSANIGGWGPDALPTGNFRNYFYDCSNLTATASLTLTNGVQLSGSDPVVAAASSASTWLYGWQPQLSPNIVTNPVSETVDAGSAATFTVAATGIPDPAYQWLKNGTNAPYPSANSAILTIPNAQAADAGAFSVVVSNGAGSATSAAGNLTVITPVAPTLGNVSVNESGGVQFSFTGTAGFNYRVWATTDLTLSPITTTWTLLSSSVFGSSPVTITDTQATNFPQRFYTVTVP